MTRTRRLGEATAINVNDTNVNKAIWAAPRRVGYVMLVASCQCGLAVRQKEAWASASAQNTHSYTAPDA